MALAATRTAERTAETTGDMPAERIPIQNRRSFDAAFNFTAKDRRNQGICGTHERTRFLFWIEDNTVTGGKIHPVRLNTRGDPHYFCTGMLCSNYCEYHRLRLCEWDQYRRDDRKRDEEAKGSKRKRDEEDQPPPPPPPEDPEETIFDIMIAPEPPPPPSPESPALEEGWRVHGEVG